MITCSLGSGGTCGDTTGNKYCGQNLHFAKDQVTSIPICDCTAPFLVRIITDNGIDAESGNANNVNRGTLLFTFFKYYHLMNIRIPILSR